MSLVVVKAVVDVNVRVKLICSNLRKGLQFEICQPVLDKVPQPAGKPRLLQQQHQAEHAGVVVPEDVDEEAKVLHVNVGRATALHVHNHGDFFRLSPRPQCLQLLLQKQNLRRHEENTVCVCGCGCLCVWVCEGVSVGVCGCVSVSVPVSVPVSVFVCE